MELSVLLCDALVTFLQILFFLSFFWAYFIELSSGVPLLYDDTPAHLKKMEPETVKVVGPWPALHVNINKV